jgi:hypothetical protein
MRVVKAVAAFWWDFIVGDDWVAAAGVVLLLAVTAGAVHLMGANPWWVLPLGVLAILAVTLRRAVGSRTSRP